MKIPMIDLTLETRALRAELDHALARVLDSGAFVLGPNVRALEAELAEFLGVRHAIGVASGTDALHLALRAAGVGPGDEVITTAFSFIATAEAITYTGAVPVFADIDPVTFNLDPQAVEAALSPRTRALLPVHLYGQAADLGPLVELARRHGLTLIEDAAQAIGAEHEGRRVGACGDLGCFSFYPTKNLGAFGDGGLVTTSDDGLAARVRSLREHGHQGGYLHGSIGFNSRLDELQAAVLRVKLPHLEGWNRARQRNAAAYAERLGDSDLILPAVAPGRTHVFHQYTVRTPERDRVRAALSAAGVASNVYYPVPIHQQPSFRPVAEGVHLPVTEAASTEVLSLPVHAHLRTDEIDRICEVLLQARR